MEVVQFEELWRRHPQSNYRRVYSWDTMPVGYFPRLLLRLSHLSSRFSESKYLSTRRSEGTLRSNNNTNNNTNNNNNGGPWVDGVIICHGENMMFIKYLEGCNADGNPPASFGSFHLEMRITRYHYSFLFHIVIPHYSSLSSLSFMITSLSCISFSLSFHIKSHYFHYCHHY